MVGFCRSACCCRWLCFFKVPVAVECCVVVKAPVVVDYWVVVKVLVVVDGRVL